MSNHQQQLNFENSKGQGLYQPPDHGSSSNHHQPPPPLMQNGARGQLSIEKELDERFPSFAQNGSNNLREAGYEPAPMNLGFTRKSLANKLQNKLPVQLQKQRSTGGQQVLPIHIFLIKNQRPLHLV